MVFQDLRSPDSNIKDSKISHFEYLTFGGQDLHRISRHTIYNCHILNKKNSIWCLFPKLDFFLGGKFQS